MDRPDAHAAPPDAPRYSWFVLGLLCAVYLSNHIDRQILMILLEPIKEEFGIPLSNAGEWLGGFASLIRR